MIKIEELIPFLKEHQIPAASICDDNLYGVMEFYNSCQKNDIKPIIGLTLKYQDKEYYCYAKNYEGYQNLLKIHTEKEKNNVTLELLKSKKNHLKIIVPFNNVEIYETLSKIFDEVFLGYHTYLEKNNALIITNQIVYVENIKALKKEDTKFLNYLKMMETGTTISNLEKEDFGSNYLNVEEIEEDAKKSTWAFIEDITIEIPKNKRFIPHYNKEIIDSYAFLEVLTKKGLLKRQNGIIKEEYQKRLEYELDTIKKMGFVDYFLIVYDYVLYAKKNNILVGPGRGSAAGSLVSYCLGITEVDPLKYDLLFERFLNQDRITMPDIDIDFEFTKRNQVISYVEEKYGYDCVAGIMTFGTLGSKLVLRDLGKCLEINNVLLNKFVGYINPKLTLKENLKNEKISQIIKERSEIKNWFYLAMKLEGYKRHISTHAAGVVISSVPLDEVIPICYSGEEMLTGVTMNYLEELGLLKMDFLALRNLTIIQNILDLITKATQKQINLNQIGFEDPKVLKLFEQADTTGIFQFESIGMIHFLEKLKPNCFDELVAALALYRPGPMQNIDSYIRRKEGKEKVVYLHQDLETILKETNGIIVYQEQIMQILSKIGGFTFQESDNIRRAMSKKKKEVILDYQKKFLEGAEKRGYQRTLAEKIYDLILKFANYGFNKAHSVSYAMIGYQMAYLKVNYPIYYIANLLNMSINTEEKTKEYLNEARKRNYIIWHPDINHSNREYQIFKNGLLLPFSVIKNLGKESTDSIIKEREENGEYTDFFDFVARTYGKSVNTKTIECLIDAGAFRRIEKSKSTLKGNLNRALTYARLKSKEDNNLFEDNTKVSKPKLFPVEEETIDEKEIEFRTFGFYISNHPATKYIDKSITKLENISKNFDKYIKCVVVIESIRQIETKQKVPMAFIKASDETAESDFVLFHQCISFIKDLKKNDLVLIEGKVTKRFDKYQIEIHNIIKQ